MATDPNTGIVNSANTIYQPQKYEGIWSQLPAGQSPAGYLLNNGATAENIGAALYMQSGGVGARATSPADAAARFRNPKKYMNKKELDAQLRAEAFNKSRETGAPKMTAGTTVLQYGNTATGQGYGPGYDANGQPIATGEPDIGTAPTLPGGAPQGNAATGGGTIQGMPIIYNAYQSKSGAWTNNDPSFENGIAGQSQHPGTLVGFKPDGTPVYGNSTVPGQQTGSQPSGAAGQTVPGYTPGGYTPGTSPGIVNAAGSVMPALSTFAPPGTPGENYQPILADVQKNQTVQGQLGDILKTGNPLIEAAKARAAQAANARGLQNSSMGVQAGEEAMVNTALPIAQQDAALYQKQALVNQDIANQFLSTKMGAKLDLQRAYEAFKQNNYMFDKDERLKLYINDSNISSAEKITALNNAAHIATANISAAASAYGVDVNARTQDQARIVGEKLAYAQLSATVNTNYANQISAILGSNLEPADKARWIDNTNSIYAGMPGFTVPINAVTVSTFPSNGQTPVTGTPTVPIAGGDPIAPAPSVPGTNDNGGG
jgi:hypothetical protein